jgi:urease accessory protein
MMKRSSEVRPAGSWQHAVDRVVLDSDERQRRRSVLAGENGTVFLLDLPLATMLRDGDGLVLDDGNVIHVAAKPEALVEIMAATSQALARFAWHLGNRHTEVQIVGDTLRIRRDHVLEAMLRSLGALITPIEAPFDPERGAYGQLQHEHGDGS